MGRGAEAAMPGARGNDGDPARAAEFVQVFPVKSGAAAVPPVAVESSLITNESGRIASVLSRSRLMESDARLLGVIRQEQQETNDSSGVKA